MTQIRPYHVPDRQPMVTEHRILEYLASLGEWETVQRRAINRKVSGSDRARVEATYAALGRLKQRRLVAELRVDAWRITQAGRAALALVDELDGQNGAA